MKGRGVGRGIEEEVWRDEGWTWRHVEKAWKEWVRGRGEGRRMGGEGWMKGKREGVKE